MVIQAFLVYGIPQNNLKRISLLLTVSYTPLSQKMKVLHENSLHNLVLLQAAYNVGGQTVSADMIQTYILGCRMPRPGQVDDIPIFT